MRLEISPSSPRLRGLPLGIPDPAVPRDELTPQELLLTSAGLALWPYLLGGSLFVTGVGLVAALLFATRPAPLDTAVERPAIKAAALEAALATLDAPPGSLVCAEVDPRPEVVRDVLSRVRAEHTLVPPEACAKARREAGGIRYVTLGRISWPNRSYATVAYGYDGRGEITLRRGETGYSLHALVRP